MVFYQKTYDIIVVGTGLAGGAAVLALYLTQSKADYEIEAKDTQIEMLQTELAGLKDSIFTDQERVRFDALRDEFDSQNEDTNVYLKKVGRAHNSLSDYIVSAKTFVENSTPRGELEESVAKQVECLNGFFDSYEGKAETLKDAIAKCYELSDMALNDASKSTAKAQAEIVNQQYAKTLDQVGEAARACIEHLRTARSYASSTRLRESRAMVDRIDQEFALMSEISSGVYAQKAVYRANQKSKEMIPVQPGEGSQLLVTEVYAE